MNEFQLIKNASLANLRRCARIVLNGREHKASAYNSSLDGLIRELRSFGTTELRAVADFKPQEWDPGSSWTVSEAADGTKTIVRQKTPRPSQSPKSDGTYAIGSKVKLLTGMFPTDAVIVKCVGARRYEVREEMSGFTRNVDEDDLSLPTDNLSF